MSTAGWARFDDFRTGTAQLFSRSAREVVATSPAQVPEVLAEVHAANRQGWWAYGFVAYEAAGGLDPSLVTHAPPDGLPLAWFAITTEPVSVPLPTAESPGLPLGPWRYEWGPEEHEAAVEAVRRYIAAGETYQCNLTTRVRAGIGGDLLALYEQLASAQRGAHNAYVDTGRFVLASASPELFFECRDDRLLMRPMKGTTRRGADPAEDRELLARLLGSAKERAENVMIVDLVRNDVARIAVAGGVSVTALCRPERYPTVHQLTSDVVARLRPEVDLVDAFRALFPCGSVTGAPKPRTMEIIRELEPTPRGVYCGAIGVTAPSASGIRARFNVAIRTVVADRHTGRATYGTGGAITWDSRPEAEYAELRAKAAILSRVPERSPGVARLRR